MAEFTLLKLNLDGATFNAPFASNTDAETEPSDEDDVGPEDDTDTSGGRGRVVGALVGLAFLIVTALVAKRALGGDEEDVELEVVTAN